MTAKPHDEHAMAVRAMESAARAFYWAAVRIGYHQFIELTGAMNEMIKVVWAMGPDFWTEEQLWPEHSLAYLAEKLRCILGDEQSARLAKHLVGGKKCDQG